MGEEGGGQETGSDYCWYVDPLDGTTNFAHGFPVYNVSIGLEKAGELIAGVVYDPTRDELFSAERGGGAYLNGERFRVSNAKRLDDALVATGFPSRRRHQNVNVHFYYQLAMLTHGVRRAGAAAIDLCYVACGRLDAFWEFGLNPWDMAAGLVILEEAGGKATDMKGNPAICARAQPAHLKRLSPPGNHRAFRPDLPRRLPVPDRGDARFGHVVALLSSV